MNSDNVAMLDTEVVSNNTVHACAPIIQLIISKNNQNRILALLSLDQHGVATEQL